MSIDITKEMIERAAIAIRQSVTKQWSKDARETWHLISEELRDRYRRDAEMALNAALNEHIC